MGTDRTVMVGYAFAYPSNVWMVSRQLKHGLMTERKPGSKFDHESWLRKSERGDKWIFCLTAARIAAYQERQ
jgi:hypothetical protein